MLPFTTRLQETRKRKHLTQREMAEYLQIATRSYQNYEGGQREPNLKTLVALADFLGVSTDYLLGRTDEQAAFDRMMETGLAQAEAGQGIGLEEAFSLLRGE